MLLALAALAAGDEAVVSRGERVEIGGGFRIPDVIRQGGARLVEVGTTNRTRIGDYAAAIGPQTRLLLRVHPSNYRITGFTAAPAPAEIAALARARGLLSVEDLGSGALFDLSRLGLPRKPTLADSVAAGFDLVAASGDKLLAGPQAGLVLGRRQAVARLAGHPLMRALRPGKLVLAALDAVLRLYRDPAHLAETVPVLAILAMPEAAVAARATRLRALLEPSFLRSLKDATCSRPGQLYPLISRSTASASGSPFPSTG
jgi:L-seryl-tRNA(Ser) seleniumtransferase